MSGRVYLVGAGPGDPGLLTVRGAELLRKAEVLVYDYLASPQLLSLAQPSCRLIYVGKRAGCHALSQEKINRLLVREGQAGHLVVRLKGGDPYIFGRGGEEALELKRAGVPFEEVPGISSTVAAAAYAGIPLTHRDYSAQAVLMTGHERPDREHSAHDWEALAKMGTLVMVMGVENLRLICRRLMEAGKAPDTPAALIQWGSTSRQRTVASTLAELPAQAEAAGLGPPSLLVVGRVVSLRQDLNWFETRPLFSKKILVTRSRQRASRLSAALSELGAEVWERPTIATEELPEGRALLAEALGRLESYSWLLLSSPTGAELFGRALWGSGRDARALAALKIAVVGPGTEESLGRFGLRADLKPANKKYVAEGLLEALLAAGVKGERFLVPRSAGGRQLLPEGLREAGAEVLDLPLYRSVRPLWEQELPGPPDAVTFTSSSTAEGLAELIEPQQRASYPAVCIGPITAETARRLGFPILAEASEATVEALAAAVVGALGREN